MVQSCPRRFRSMSYPTHLLPTTVVGSYPQPDWLVNRTTLHQHGVPRAHAHDMWRVPEALLEQAQDDATVLAIRDMERAGIDIVTDGEIRRESYYNRFALALEGGGADPAGGRGGDKGRAFPAGECGPNDQDHAAGAVHAVAAGAERFLCR